MNVLYCPYCNKAMAMPPPSEAGKFFDCIHCGSRFRFTGAGAMPPPPQAAPLTSRPVVAAAVISHASRQSPAFGFPQGVRLFCQCMGAIVAEIVLTVLIGIGMSANRAQDQGLAFASFMGYVLLATLLIGLGAPIVGAYHQWIRKPG